MPSTRGLSRATVLAFSRRTQGFLTWFPRMRTPNSYRLKQSPKRNPSADRQDSSLESASGERGHFRYTSASQYDQTTVWATLRMMLRKEVGQSLQGRVRFVVRVRLQHGNNRDCSAGAFFARRRGLGIFAVAALTRIPNQRAHVLFDPVCGLPGGRSAPNSIR